MYLFGSILGLLIFISACILHVLSHLTTARASKIIAYMNILVHLCLFAILLVSQVPLDEMVLAFLLSLVVYVCSFFIIEKIKGGTSK